MAAPILQNQNPAPMAPGIAPDTTVYLEIVDGGTGLDAATIRIAVQGSVTWLNGAKQGDFAVTRAAVAGGWSFSIRPLFVLHELDTITVEVYAEDGGGPPDILNSAYTFDTRGQVLDALAQLPLLQVDDFTLNTTADAIALCCRHPSPNTTGVLVTEPIVFTLIGTEGSALTHDLVVSVRTNGVKRVVYTEATGVTAPGWSVQLVYSQSFGSAVQDVCEVTLRHSFEFVSLELVTVELTASTGLASGSWAYAFTVQDATTPGVAAVTVLNPRKLRVRFDEVVDQGAGVGSAIYTLNVAGGHTIQAPDTILLPSANVPQRTVGMFIGMAGMHEAPNNGCFGIKSRPASTQIQAETLLLRAEQAPALKTQQLNIEQRVDHPQMVISSYRLRHVAPAGGVIEPAFCPIVLSAEVPSARTVPSFYGVGYYVDLLLQDDLSPDVQYTLDVSGVMDAEGNEASCSYSFPSWSSERAGRAFDPWEDMLPERIREADHAKDTERLARCYADVIKVLLRDTDARARLLDPDITPDSALAVLLQTLGCPLESAAWLHPAQKRDLIPLLVPLYKEKGTAPGIVDALAFFLDMAAQVRPFFDPEAIWCLGLDYLGANSTLGPAAGWARYAFDVVVDRVPTAQELVVILEIVEFIKPAHTHFVRLVTPTTSTAFWWLGASYLGYSTALATGTPGLYTWVLGSSLLSSLTTLGATPGTATLPFP